MLNDLNIGQRNLADFMSKLSEKCYSAQWMENLEYVLWSATINGPKKYGQALISKANIDQLTQLSKICNCWILFDNIVEETAVDLAEWSRRYSEAVSLNPNIINS